MNKLTGFLLTFAVTAAGPAALAEAPMEAKAVLVISKAIGFALPPAEPGAKIAVLGNAAQLDDVTKVLPKFSVSNDAKGAYAAFVSNAEEAKSVGQHVLTIGPLACVEANACVLAIALEPKVSIYLSSAAAKAAGFDFDPNFKLMITSR